MVAEPHPLRVRRQTVLAPPGVVLPKRSPVEVDARAPFQGGGEHGHDGHIGQAVGGTFRPGTVVAGPDRPDAAQHWPQPLEPRLRFRDVLVKDQGDVRQEDDLAAGVRIEARQSVGSPVVHVIERHPPTLPELGDDGLAFLVREPVPHPVAGVRAVPDHRHVSFVVVGQVARPLRIPAGDRRHPPARGAGEPVLPAHQPGQGQGLRALDETPGVPHHRTPDLVERLIALPAVRETGRLFDLVGFRQHGLGASPQALPRRGTLAESRRTQRRHLLRPDVDPRVLRREALQPLPRRRHLHNRRRGFDLKGEDLRHRARPRGPAPEVPPRLEGGLGKKQGILQIPLVQADLLEARIPGDLQAIARGGIHGKPGEYRRIRPRPGVRPGLPRISVRVRMSVLLHGGTLLQVWRFPKAR